MNVLTRRCLFAVTAAMVAICSAAESEARLEALGNLLLGGQYTDNLFFNDASKKSDFGTFIAPSLTLSYRSRNLVLGGTYTGMLQYYAENKNANTYAQFTNTSIDLPFLTRRYQNLTVQITERFTFTPQLPAFGFAYATAAPGTTYSPGSLGVGGHYGAPGGGFGGATATQGPGAAPGAGVGGAAETQGPGAAPGGPAQQTTGTNQPPGGVGGYGGAVSNSGAFTPRANAFANTSGLSATYAWTTRLDTSVGYLNQFVTFDSAQLVDSLNHSGSVRVGYRVTPTSQVNATYSMSYLKWLGGSGGQGSLPSILTNYGLLGFSHRLQRDLSLTWDVGGAYTANLPFRIATNAALTKPVKGGSVALRYSQFISGASGFAATATLNQLVTAEAYRIFSPRASGSLQFGYGRVRSLTGGVIDIDSYNAAAGLSLHLMRTVFANLTYRFLRQESAGTAGVTATNNQVFVGLTMTAPPWLLLR